jgi:hypothetical protein
VTREPLLLINNVKRDTSAQQSPLHPYLVPLVTTAKRMELLVKLMDAKFVTLPSIVVPQD